MATDPVMPRLLNRRRQSAPAAWEYVDFDDSSPEEMLPRSLFIKLLCLERKRAERSGRGFVLMLLAAPSLLRQKVTSASIQQALSRSTRETDVRGWHKNGEAIGVIFTETPLRDATLPELFSGKINRALREVLAEEQMAQIRLSFHVFPEHFDGNDSDRGTIAAVYPDVAAEIESRRIPLLVKRGLDAAGSAFAILALSPLLALIVLAVRLTSSGPALFRQKRVGQFGKNFTFLKFRSMRTASDPAIHEAYIKSFIANQADGGSPTGERAVYKLKADPRVTPVGRFLRRTSLDELPQLFNVLMGQMSLVGPRPPVLYEFASYNTWHKRRLLAVKPGITGIWQVEGRSRVKFDDMVRMDLEYARVWSVWFDIKILLRTPRAVLSGEGAY
jgi:lipopolysaccharide/colanic/teichoic acid biosynthesis glycosyltransferase